MTIEIVWDNEAQTIIKHIYTESWTLDEFHQAVDKNAQMISSVSHPVDIIADLSESSARVNQLLSAISNVERKTPDNQRLTLIVGADRLIEILLSVASRIAPKSTHNLHIVATIDEAYEFIANYPA